MVFTGVFIFVFWLVVWITPGYQQKTASLIITTIVYCCYNILIYMFDVVVIGGGPVSYTHLTLPTNREV